MATQGIVSVLVNGRVVCKAIAGCGGMEAPYLASLIAQERLVDPGEIHDLATRVGFGCRACLVVRGEDGRWTPSHAVGSGPLTDERYARTFGDSRFNPRWERGAADYVEIVEL